ncbi:protein FAR1-RELATED SEQUENCE 9-like [Dioscorea cayenensis subsp. rotundata]|uniref:Protein FAR1-RELATED SEQUENCE n=1 Tax=Dioscorea cayennensis subsp. rotundata TaxID=55577 RepID=A0AB40B8H2_DIOCR|nr:protein FAR1-RELATED SEQUENCE 9-like [Dioscorea cayenensis subsp. rotundata]
MTSTQRSESINSFCDAFVNAQTPLDEFVIQYDKALFARRNDEENEDFKTLNSIANYYTSHPIEKHAREVYTRAVFNIFQVELQESDSMLAERVRDGSENAKYIICNETFMFSKDCIEDGKPSATCSCKKFEREGVLCRHILKIFKKKKEVAKVPKRYMLRLWTMDARYRSSVMMVETCNNAFTPLMKWNAQSISSLEMYEKIMTKLKDIFEILGEMSSAPEHRSCTEQNDENQEIIGSSSCLALSSEDNVCGSNISILDPKSIKSTGRPRVNTRIESTIDLQLSAKRKKKLVVDVEERGHVNIFGLPELHHEDDLSSTAVMQKSVENEADVAKLFLDRNQMGWNENTQVQLNAIWEV